MDASIVFPQVRTQSLRHIPDAMISAAPEIYNIYNDLSNHYNYRGFLADKCIYII
jgi:hypothetical protein